MDAKLFTLIKYIKENRDWFDKLQNAPYHLKIRKHPQIENRYLFSYNQIYSDFNLDICKVARGLVLEISDSNYGGIRVIARGFNKFHNFGEGAADVINWNGKIYARAKYDGSLIKLFVDGEKLAWMTNNSFDANAPLPGDLICEYDTFQDLIDEAMNHSYSYFITLENDDTIHPYHGNALVNTQKGSMRVGYLKNNDYIDNKKIINIEKVDMGKKMLPNLFLLSSYTFMFELISEFNRIVCKYPITDLIFLGARDNETGNEYAPETILNQFSSMKGFVSPEIFELSSKNIDEVKSIVEKFDSNSEGIVVQDENFNRIKIKGSSYLSIHSLKDNSGQLSHKHVLQCIQENTIDDVLNIFPEYKQKIHEIINKYKNISNQIDEVILKSNDYLNVVNKNNDEKERKKVYALLVKDSPYSNIYFNIYKDKSKSQDYKNDFLKNLDYDKLESLNKK
jgi:hypothetical protein